MKVSDLPIHGLKLIELDVYRDERGFFTERFSEVKWKAAGLPLVNAQDNHSRSVPGVIRGLHFQHRPTQGKLVGVIRGRIWDVAVDLRPNSRTFGRHFAMELTDDAGKLFWIPPGFAHGFRAIGDEPADVIYKVDAPYNPAGEAGIRWDDPDLGISWPGLQQPNQCRPLVSKRDAALPSLDQLRPKLDEWFSSLSP